MAITVVSGATFEERFRIYDVLMRCRPSLGIHYLEERTDDELLKMFEAIKKHGVQRF